MGDIIHGDCLEVMRGMEPESIDAIVTDPPYGLKFMGKEWDHGLPGVAFWTEAIRVSKPGAHLLAFGGTRTFHRLACAIEDAGWEIRDCLMWVYGSGFPKSHNLKGEHEGWGTALKPAWEPIIMARKPLDGTVAQNVQKWGCGAINVDGCLVGTDVVSVHNAPKGTFAGGEIGRGSDTESYRNHHGRWPANLIHDGSNEVVGMFPQSKSTGGSGEASKNWKGDGHTIGASCQATGGFGDSGSAARFFYCAKASRAEREAGLEGMEKKDAGTLAQDPWSQENFGNAGTGRKAANHHPTVKPVALMRYLCRLVTPPNGLILDPFAGSGSTLIAANQEGFRYIGIEKDAGYHEIACRRVAPIEQYALQP